MADAGNLPQQESVETFTDCARRIGKRSPDAVALTYGVRRTTYGELDRLSNRGANGIIASGVAQGSRIAILDKNSDRFFELLFGAAKAGVVLVPINARLAPSEIAFAIRDSEAELLFIGEAFAPAVASIRNQLSTV